MLGLTVGSASRAHAWLLHFLEDQSSHAHLPVLPSRRGGRRKHHLVAVPFDFSTQRRSGEYLVPRDIDVMLDGLPVKRLPPAIRGHCSKQLDPLLIGHLVEAFRFWPLASDQKDEHSAVFAVRDVAGLVAVFLLLARLEYSRRGADQPIRAF